MSLPLLSVRVLRGEPSLGKVRALAMEADGSAIWAGAESGVVEVLRAPGGEVVRRFQAHAGGVNAVVLAGERLVTGGNDGKVRMWDALQLAPLWQADAPGRRVRSVALSTDERLVCAVTWSGHAQYWDLEGRPRSEAVHVDHGSERDFHRECVLPAPEGGRLRGIGDLLERRAVDGSVVWSATLSGFIEVLAMTGHGERVAVAGRARDRKGLLALVDAAQGKASPTAQLPYNASSLVFSPDGGALYAGGLGRVFQVALDSLPPVA